MGGGVCVKVGEGKFGKGLTSWIDVWYCGGGKGSSLIPEVDSVRRLAIS